MSLIFTPGVIAKAPKAIDSIGGGDFIWIFGIFFVIHSLINGIWVPPPTKTIEFKSSTVQNLPLAWFNKSFSKELRWLRKLFSMSIFSNISLLR